MYRCKQSVSNVLLSQHRNGKVFPSLCLKVNKLIENGKAITIILNLMYQKSKKYNAGFTDQGTSAERDCGVMGDQINAFHHHFINAW